MRLHGMMMRRSCLSFSIAALVPFLSVGRGAFLGSSVRCLSNQLWRPNAAIGSSTSSSSSDVASVVNEGNELFEQYVMQTVGSLKAELKHRNLPTTGRKPELARRLAENEVQAKYGMTTEKGVAKSVTLDDGSDARVAVATSAASATADDESIHKDECEAFYQKYAVQSANSLKVELKHRQLPATGRKPDLARRLADYDIQAKYGVTIQNELSSVALEESASLKARPSSSNQASTPRRISKFAGLILSEKAGIALGNAGFETPSPIQTAAIPRLARGESLILQAETGSGKTLAYLLPVTEQLWKDRESGEDSAYVVVMTPTRELATQVAGVAAALAPKGAVRLLTHPSNLMPKFMAPRDSPVLFVGSSKCIMQSLYGDGVMPASPTPKPLALVFLKNIRCLILDEVDRILNIKGEKNSHEKPAAIVTAAAMRQTLGRVQIVAASATVGRPLRRELARVLGLAPQECPQVVLGKTNNSRGSRNGAAEASTGHVPRAITLPETLENYIVTVNDSSPGKLLTMAYSVIHNLATPKPRRMLLVLSKGFGINVQNSIGALRHFGCNPDPHSLLDELQANDSESMIETYSAVSGAIGVGESLKVNEDETQPEGYLLVTGEDSVRGLHFDGLDVVIILGRPNGPDEYLHIAGRTARAGRSGKVINVISDENAAALQSWERMLEVQFTRLQLEDLTKLD